ETARGETDIRIITNVSLHETGALANGLDLPTALKELESLGADVVGVNCRFGPAQMVTSLETVPRLDKAFIAAYPNARLPAYRDGVLYYENEPDYFKTTAKDLRDQGVRLIGGCCGTTPEHVRALAEGVEGLAPITEKVVKELEPLPIIQDDYRKGDSLADVARERYTVIVDLDAPKHLDLPEYVEGAKALKEAGVDAITLADNSLARPRISNVAVAAVLKDL